jgi:NAD-dependent deacetylase
VTDLDRAADLLAEARRVTVLTGAGISTESGIPDYRGPGGVWTTDPAKMRLVDIDVYVSDPEVRREAWLERMHHPAWTAQPNAGHRALADLQQTGKLLVLATQNIDGLHPAAGSDPDLVLELHGTIHRAKCLSCDRRTPMQEQLDRVRAGNPDPACTECGGIQKSATIAFGESLDPDVLDRALTAASEADTFMAIGTSLAVFPVATLFPIAKRSGARCLIINADPTPYDDIADVVIHDRIGDVLPQLVT